MVGLLRSGEHRDPLSAYFGPAVYRELRKLALAPSGPRSGRVYLLPGFMGSRLIAAATQRLLWLDPAELACGELHNMALPGESARVLGAMLPGYLKLRLSLENAGFDVRVFAYDWRKSIATLGKSLAHALATDSAREVSLVAHSMGGLVARAAMRYASGAKIRTLIQLGTPNLGSFALVQALRGVYPTVLKLAAIDQRHTPAELTRQVFGTLPSLYEMLPRGELSAGLDFFDADSWPHDVLQPDRRLLRRAQKLPQQLAEADRRCHAIVGVGCATNVGVQRNGPELVYRFNGEGDGTVPSRSAAWPGAKIWYANVAHGELTKNSIVCRAIVDLLNERTTRRLRSKAPAHGTTSRTRREAALRAALNGKVRWQDLPLTERRRLLEPRISSSFKKSTYRR